MRITTENASQELLRFRETHGITLEKMVEKTGLSKPTLINIEKGKKKPQATTIYKLNKYVSLFN